MDGMVCSPVSIDPIAVRSTRELDTAMPRTVPITRETPKPSRARVTVLPRASQNFGSPRKARSSTPTVAGDGST